MIVAGIILIVLIFVSRLPVGVSLGYDNGALSIEAVFAFIKRKIYPPQRKKKKKEKKAGSFALPDFLTEDKWELLKLVLEALGRFRRRLCMDHFRLRYISAGDDPYRSVMRYNSVNALMSGLAPAFENAFYVKKREIVLDVDFSGESVFELGFSLSIRIHQILSLGVLTLISLLKLRSRSRNERKSSDGEQVKRSNAVNDEQH